MGGGVGVFSWSKIVGIGDVGSDGVVVVGLGMVELEHAVSAMVRMRYIQEDFFNVENLMRSLTRRACPEPLGFARDLRRCRRAHSG